MVDVPFRRGEVLFKEGEIGDFVCLIVAGEVEVIKELDEQRVVLGTLKAGEYVGEMSVLEGHTRSATIRAITDGTVELIGRTEFLKRVAEDGETALKLLVRLSERLRSADRKFAAAAVSLAGQSPDAEVYDDEEEEGPVSLRLTVFPAGPSTEGAIPIEGMVIRDFPFVVGRRVESASSSTAPIQMLLDDRSPFRLSRIHFAFERDANGRIGVRDLGSTLGTQVNGEFLGGDAPRDRMPLEIGQNLVLAGGENSPFAFLAIVEDDPLV